jgi:hypothetical protein
LPVKEGAPGVPGVSGVIELVKQVAGEKHHLNVDELNQKLNNVQPVAKYTTAIKFLLDRVNQDAVNDVVRQAVRLARRNSEGDKASSDEELERDYNGWAVSPGGQALAELVVRFPEKYQGPIVTTNFDPLIKIAIQQQGGIPYSTVLDVDGSLRKSGIESTDQREIVYLHGYWRGDTLHTPVQLQMERPYLTASLQSLLRRQMMVVVGYGGWDDVFTRALTSAVFDLPDLDVVWAFHDREPALIEEKYEKLFNSVRNAIGTGRFRSYIGIDCNAFFRDLLAYETASETESDSQDRPSAQSAGKQPTATAQDEPFYPPDSTPHVISVGPAEYTYSNSFMEILGDMTRFVELANDLGEWVVEFQKTADEFDFAVNTIKSRIVTIYQLATEKIFGAERVFQHEFRTRDKFKESYHKLDDAIDVYDYVLERFKEADSTHRASMQEREELVAARRKAILSLYDFCQVISLIAERGREVLPIT